MTRKFEFSDPRGGAALGVRVVTRAAVTEIVGRQEDGAVKIRLKASPAGAPEANSELIAFLAAQLGVEQKQIEIVAGGDNRDKILSIEGLSSDEVETKLGIK